MGGELGELMAQGRRIVDLTHVMIPGREQYGLEVAQRGTREGATGDIMSEVSMWSHAGTHVEVPRHFYADGKDTSDFCRSRRRRSSTKPSSRCASRASASVCASPSAPR